MLEHDQWAAAVQAYLATISFADAQIGRILDALDASGRAPRTVIVFYSDNGFHLGEKRHWHKSTLWERATHVPFIVVAPGVGRHGRIDRPVSLQDVYPTLTALCGLPVGERERLDGDDLVPLLKDPDRRWREGTITTFRPGNHAVRTARWRYIRYHDGGEELYDRDADPHEQANLAGRAEFAATVADLASLLPAGDAPPVPEKQEYRFDPRHYRWHRRADSR